MDVLIKTHAQFFSGFRQAHEGVQACTPVLGARSETDTLVYALVAGPQFGRVIVQGPVRDVSKPAAGCPFWPGSLAMRWSRSFIASAGRKQAVKLGFQAFPVLRELAFGDRPTTGRNTPEAFPKFFQLLSMQRDHRHQLLIGSAFMHPTQHHLLGQPIELGRIIAHQRPMTGLSFSR